MSRKFTLSLGAVCVAMALNSYAQEETTLDTIRVDGTQIESNQENT